MEASEFGKKVEGSICKMKAEGHLLATNMWFEMLPANKVYGCAITLLALNENKFEEFCKLLPARRDAMIATMFNVLERNVYSFRSGFDGSSFYTMGGEKFWLEGRRLRWQY